MIGYPVVGGYRIGSSIVGSKAVDGCGERQSFWITDEGDRDGMKKHAHSTTVA